MVFVMWIRLAIIILVGIAMIIFGAYGVRQVNKDQKRLKHVLDTVEKANHTIIFLGVCFLFFGCFFCIQNMMEEGFIVDISNTLSWKLVQWFVTFTLGVLLIVLGKLVRKKRIDSTGWKDIQVTGTVVGVAPQTNTLPGWGRLIIEYKDPYDDSIKRFTLMQDLKLKAYPIGSRYILSYSRIQKNAYDVETNKLSKKLEIFLFFMGVLVCVVVSFYIVLYIMVYV